jgi:hypothetical protein
MARTSYTFSARQEVSKEVTASNGGKSIGGENQYDQPQSDDGRRVARQDGLRRRVFSHPLF